MFKVEAMIQSGRIRGVLAPVVTPLKLVRCPLARSYPRHFTLITRTSRACASYLAALPSFRAIPNRDVFYVAGPVSSIQGPSFARRTSRRCRWGRELRFAH